MCVLDLARFMDGCNISLHKLWIKRDYNILEDVLYLCSCTIMKITFTLDSTCITLLIKVEIYERKLLQSVTQFEKKKLLVHGDSCHSGCEQ